ncbi:MAG TPA: flagellar basal body protein [Rhizomicrobium sp.]|jgi:flagellar basal-body rod protein FlgB|nr:flagellar basal body protein [Rhizomicrobium sp.]
MNLPDVPLLAMLKGRMTWLEARQQVLSQNVSNADTPGYVPRDVDPVDFDSLMRKAADAGRFQGGLAITDPRHIAATPSSPSPFTSRETPDVSATPTGNSVSLEAEMIKVSDTEAQFQAATNLYSKTLSLMRTAIGKPGP